MNKRLRGFSRCFFLFYVPAVFLLSACSEDIDKEDIEATIESVENGNTVILSTGTPVHLKGIKAGNMNAKEYIEKRYIGKEVVISIDSLDQPTIADYDEDFWAYVKVKESNHEKECVNRQLLETFGINVFDGSDHIQDSLEVYRNIANPKMNRNELDPKSIATKMKAASMQIYGINDSSLWLGTAFFISGSGLALTNCHCVEGATAMCALLSDGEGNVDRNRQFSIDIVYKDKEHDFAVFYVNLDEDTRKHLVSLELTRYPIVANEDVWSVGNPAPAGIDTPLSMRINSGNVSSYNDSEQAAGLIGINIPITHGFSGGPVCNKYGEVIGINVGGYSHSDANLNYAVDIKMVRAELDRLHKDYNGK